MESELYSKKEELLRRFKEKIKDTHDKPADNPKSLINTPIKKELTPKENIKPPRTSLRRLNSLGGSKLEVYNENNAMMRLATKNEERHNTSRFDDVLDNYFSAFQDFNETKFSSTFSNGFDAAATGCSTTRGLLQDAQNKSTNSRMLFGKFSMQNKTMRPILNTCREVHERKKSIIYDDNEPSEIYLSKPEMKRMDTDYSFDKDNTPFSRATNDNSKLSFKTIKDFKQLIDSLTIEDFNRLPFT